MLIGRFLLELPLPWVTGEGSIGLDIEVEAALSARLDLDTHPFKMPLVFPVGVGGLGGAATTGLEAGGGTRSEM